MIDQTASRIKIKQQKKRESSYGNNVKKRGLSIISPIALSLLWEVAVRIHLLDNRFFPAPSTILTSIGEMIRSGLLFSDLGISLYRIFGGFLLGAIQGFPSCWAGMSPGTRSSEI
jgi:NitT/TauT family transport system permease protein